MMGDVDTDALRERLRQRLDPSEYDAGYCRSCEVQLTAADVEAGACTNCDAVLEEDDSADEDLADDGHGDY